MSRKAKDNQFLCLSSILRAKEAKLLTKADYERMIAEPSYTDTCRIAAEHGFEDMSGMNVSQVNDCLADYRAEELQEIRELIPDESLLDLFRMKYGYHNSKVLVKSKGDLSKTSHMLSDSARYSVEELREVYDSEEGDGNLEPIYAAAIRDAKKALARTNNPMLSDFIIDKAYYSELLKEARKTGKKYIVDFVKFDIDKANLRSTLRTMYMGKRGELLKYALIPGGTIEIDEILNSMETKDDLIRLYSSTIFYKAAEAATMTEFEQAADNAVTDFISSGSYIPFGPEVVIEYVSALENELQSLRIILTGKLMGITQEQLRERLRESYV